MVLQTIGFFPIIRINNLKNAFMRSQALRNNVIINKFLRNLQNQKIINNFTLKPLNFPKKFKELNSLQPSFFNLENKYSWNFFN